MSDFAKALRRLSHPRLIEDPPVQASGPPGAGEFPLSLQRQLDLLKSRFGVAAAWRAAEGRSTGRSLPHGTEESTSFGAHYVVRSVYSSGHYHGKIRLDRFSMPDLDRLMALLQPYRARIPLPDRDAVVFLDTETTGIQGGTGMCPFLVGLGYFAGDDFHMAQYFIRDFDEEPSMLSAIGEFLERFRLVVTYNGASFDIPLMETRFTLARLESPFGRMAHLDLLPGARKLWRNTHGSCRLVALESRVVSFFRGPDIPGAMIPRAYFDFIQGYPVEVLGSVFRHNVHDVVTLAALTVCACDRLALAPAMFDDPLDVYSLARILENTPEWTRSLALYESCLPDLPEDLRRRAQESLVVLYRRSGTGSRTLELCLDLVRNSEFSMVGYEGAAIHYERVLGDAGLAVDILERGLARLDTMSGSKRRKALLQSRRDRLQQKALLFQ